MRLGRLGKILAVFFLEKASEFVDSLFVVAGGLLGEPFRKDAHAANEPGIFRDDVVNRKRRPKPAWQYRNKTSGEQMSKAKVQRHVDGYAQAVDHSIENALDVGNQDFLSPFNGS